MQTINNAVKKKLLLLNDVNSEDMIGGQATFLHNIIPYLKKHYEVRLLVLPKSFLKITLIPRRLMYLAYVLLKFRTIKSSDIIFSHTPESAFIATLFNSKKLFHVFHGNTNSMTTSKYWYGKYFKWLFTWFDNTIMRKSRLCYTVGESRSNTNHLYQPIDIDFLNSVQPATSKRSNFLFVGRLEKVKQVDKIIVAFKEYLSKTGSNNNLLICGNGILENSYKKIVAREGIENQVEFKGKTSYEEVISLMKSTKILFMASMYEGFPMVIAEALCCGLPVISTNVGSIEKIIVNRKNGVLLPIDFTATDYADAIREIESNQAEFSKQAFDSGQVFNASSVVNDILLRDFSCCDNAFQLQPTTH
jgi:glycosyltransferase involved in cell wall biosynthesis